MSAYKADWVTSIPFVETLFVQNLKNTESWILEDGILQLTPCFRKKRKEEGLSLQKLC
jgi:hypothetical protein